MPPPKIALADKLASFDECWSPRVVAELNRQHVRLAHLEGEFIWHDHPHEDEMFLVLEGSLTLEFRDGSVDLVQGDMLVVPAGVEHRPVASRGRCSVMLFEPASTRNTGNIENERTKRDLPRV